jgi:hypothetical protein
MMQEINLVALDQTLTLLFGNQHRELVTKLYTAFDQTMKAGYELGMQKGQENLEAACDASFDNGWEHGEQEGRGVADVDATAQISTAYDDGYLHGVGDARSQPHLADEIVQDIINVRAEDFYEALDAVTFAG